MRLEAELNSEADREVGMGLLCGAHRGRIARQIQKKKIRVVRVVEIEMVRKTDAGKASVFRGPYHFLLRRVTVAGVEAVHVCIP